MLSALTIWVLYLIISVACAELPACTDTANADYDFIVVGAGAGGGPLAARLAEAGYSVLLVDAGHDTVNYNTTIPAYFIRSLEDPQIDLNYTYQEYPTGFFVTRDNQWYPRARALGGSTIHNAMINIISGTRQDFDGLATAFNDSTWSRDNMQLTYFRRIEDNLYLVPLLSPDHGFHGWLKTSLLPFDVFSANPFFLDPQISALATSQWDPLVAGPPILDLNSLSADSAVGVGSTSFTIDGQHVRSSVRDRLAAVQQSHPGQLHLSLDTLATKILVCNSSSTVTAYGVQIAPGAALPVASNFKGKVALDMRNVTARHEVIVSAGVFQSPQLLMLSGIGDEAQLSQFGIEAIVHLPGVGTNLQDHDEVAVNWLLKDNYTLFHGCKWLSDRTDDPCLEYWLTHNHENGYAFAGAMNSVITKSSSSPPEAAPDVLTYWDPVIFRGFFRGVPQEVVDNHKGLTAVVLKGHPSSKGTVKLTGSHPQDPLDIQKLHFQAPGGSADIAAIREGIKRARELISLLPISPFVQEEIAPGPTVITDDQIDNYIYNHVFGHHACCTNAIGPDTDPNAVLDGNFNVRGVKNLRVVDLSSWPNVPGFFVTTPTYMMSEKAADVIIAKAHSA
ncbi:hypothetical protein H2248_012388 [Termitomyces sp. 'cryptogamus']|nr:hypothetical protein H2248_012388 [Termitomyces sp. 'cryptogamus']